MDITSAKPMITTTELLQCKRAVVVLAEIAKHSMKVAGVENPLGLKQDMKVLTDLLRRLESQAHKDGV